jgi:hypothetical protein
LIRADVHPMEQWTSTAKLRRLEVERNLLKQDKTSKRGVHGKCLKAGWGNGYILHLPGNYDAIAQGNSEQNFTEGVRNDTI